MTKITCHLPDILTCQQTVLAKGMPQSVRGSSAELIGRIGVTCSLQVVGSGRQSVSHNRIDALSCGDLAPRFKKTPVLGPSNDGVPPCCQRRVDTPQPANFP